MASTAFENAFNAFIDTFAAPLPQPYDPVDDVTATYPPLMNDTYYALQWAANPGGAPLAISSCAESALTLAMWQVWNDEKAKLPVGQNPPPPPMLEVTCPLGLTVVQMRRRLQRVGLEHFPVFEYDVGNDMFTLISGKEREDHLSILFIPQDPAQGLQQAHWTYGRCVETERPDDFGRLRFPANQAPVVYSRLPVADRDHFWRAEVVPENVVEYQDAATQGWACDCDWRIVCQHEEAYYAGRVPYRVTLDGERHVLGTARAIVLKAKYGRMSRITDSRVCFTTARGMKIERDGMSPDLALKPRTFFYELLNWRTTNRYLELGPATQVDIGPYRTECRLIPREDALLQWKLPTLRTVVVAAAVAAEHRTFGRVAHVEWDTPSRPWAADQDLSVRLPRKAELLNRLACRNELTKDSVLDTIRRMAAEEKWNIDVDRDELRLWLARVVSEVGKMMIPGGTGSSCWSCCRNVPTYRHMCKDCRKASTTAPPERLPIGDHQITHVGYRPIWSKRYQLPAFELKDDASVYWARPRRLLLGPGSRWSLHDFLKHLATKESPCTCRGYLRGPMFLSQEPTCFPRGEIEGLRAFLVRLGARRACEAQVWFYDRAFDFVQPFLQVIDPESWDYFIAHFHGEDRQKNLDARAEDCEGWAPPLVDDTVRMRMSGFPKGEKSYNFEYDKSAVLVDKKTEKPRFICSPSPLMLSKLGRWTHAQTKWLAKRFHCRKRMFYAGCACPEELNSWLNWSLEEINEPWTLADDISAIDANHNAVSFEWHKRVRNEQFPHISEWFEAAFEAERKLKVRVGHYLCCVSDVNASGVSDTSYKNSLICIVVRSMALLHGFRDLRTMTKEQFLADMRALTAQVLTAASGDDGLVRMPDKVLGKHISEFSIAAYREAWAWAGFEVKVAIIPPNRWRMATFLAMRPVWAGTRYEWAPEPARRMRGMFWQLDNPQHPTAWARGIATQVLQQARHVPVISHVCEWFLAKTTGPTADVMVTSSYSAFFGLESSGVVNERSVAEFCVDYHVTKGDIDRFVGILWSSDDTLVNVDTHVIRRIYAEES